MSERLLHIFYGNSPLSLADPSGVEAKADEPKLTWKVVLRTGTWKLRPGPGGAKLDEPLKIYRDKAPKGHISMSALKTNFDAGAKENVTMPIVHADGTVSDSGFVRKLVIQDVAGEDGSKKTQSLLWAGCEVTDSAVKTKIDEKSLVGCSAGILFDYQRTEDAKKFDQIISHLMITNSPWIGGCGGFVDKLPEGVMAADDFKVPESEISLDAPLPISIHDRVMESREDLSLGRSGKIVGTKADDDGAIIYAVQWEGGDVSNDVREYSIRKVSLDYVDPTADAGAEKDKLAEGTVVWRPEDGFQFMRNKVQRALDSWRRAVMAAMPKDSYSYDDFPYMHVDDVTNDGTTRKALICSGYGDSKDSWVATFSLDDDKEVVVEPFENWTEATQEWVAASESIVPPTPPKAKAKPAPVVAPQRSMADLSLAEAQARRAENHSSPHTTTGGRPMGKLSELLTGVDLSDEQRAALAAHEADEERKDARLRKSAEDAKANTVTSFLSEMDGLGLGDNDTPGLRVEVRNILLSDDGGVALNLSETTESGQRTEGVDQTATDIVKRLIKALPRNKEGKVALSEQARLLPGDPKPEAGKAPPEGEGDQKDTRSLRERAAAMLAETGIGDELGIKVPAGKES